MDYRAESRITQCAEYLHVDFGSSSSLELSETYRRFAHLCIGTQVHGALLTAGDNDPEGHRRLGDALSEMARAAALSPDFKLALVPSTPPIQAIYREAQQALRAMGLNAWVFDTAGEAVQWLVGRAACGPTAS
jgi:hypothetical protein